MGYIYLVINKINNKKYVGFKMLILGVEPRISAHKTEVITVSPYELSTF